jgi:hypothetical protein
MQAVQASDDNLLDDFLAQQSSVDRFSDCLTFKFFTAFQVLIAGCAGLR